MVVKTTFRTDYSIFESPSYHNSFFFCYREQNQDYADLQNSPYVNTVPVYDSLKQQRGNYFQCAHINKLKGKIYFI